MLYAQSEDSVLLTDTYTKHSLSSHIRYTGPHCCLVLPVCLYTVSTQCTHPVTTHMAQ